MRLAAIAPCRESHLLARRIDEIQVSERTAGRFDGLVDDPAHDRGLVKGLRLLEQLDQKFELLLAAALRDHVAAPLRDVTDHDDAVAAPAFEQADAHFDIEGRAVLASMLGLVAPAAADAAELQAH